MVVAVLPYPGGGLLLPFLRDLVHLGTVEPEEIPQSHGSGHLGYGRGERGEGYLDSIVGEGVHPADIKSNVDTGTVFVYSWIGDGYPSEMEE